MEYVSLGKLQQFLRESRAGRHYGNTHAGSLFLTSRDLTHFAYQVARGMDFLSSKGVSDLIVPHEIHTRTVYSTEKAYYLISCTIAEIRAVTLQ